MHVYKDIIWCKSVSAIKPGIDPCPLLAWLWDRWLLDFVTFTAYKKSRFSLKRHGALLLNRCKDLFKPKKYFGVRCTLINNTLDRSQSTLDQHLDRYSVGTRFTLQQYLNWHLNDAWLSVSRYTASVNQPICTDQQSMVWLGCWLRVNWVSTNVLIQF